MNFVTKEPIRKGWSGDKKYCVTDELGKRYLLRVSALSQRDKKYSEFQRMQAVAALGIPMCLPLEFGICDEWVYSLQSWIYGVDAEDVMADFPEAKQYTYGLEAGRILRKIHTIPAPAGLEAWDLRYNRKMDRKIENYQNCPLKYEKGQVFIDFIENNRHLLKDRPQTYQHGDYHIGNMMISNSGALTIIDFNRDDFGDPWNEFNRIVWCVQASPVFASGMVDGYFEGNIPLAFWKLLALYIASNTLSSLPWAHSFGEEEIATMRSQAEQVLAWYDDMRTPIPAWYTDCEFSSCIFPGMGL